MLKEEEDRGYFLPKDRTNTLYRNILKIMNKYRISL